ncbi:farnesyl-diphosphate farnesyltransferase [Pleurotus eryngii]|uniref:Squalene synthase n=1 Tax=Pleurotus eryngii TaxID=5323 RepID=A0A9P6A1J2_PLEER|nr:farnesyl-diphosphate farnesyltransferase [Pleurotus eryngii]
MGFTSMFTLLLTHPLEFKTLVQFYLYHEQKRDISSMQEYATSGWDRKSMRRCWEFLDQTSRSFSAVVKELEGDLARIVCLFYLVLRALDTIEDDMTIPDEVKQPILRSFHAKTVTTGWKFDGNGPDEKDRQLLVEYDTVIEEVNRLPTEYRAVILSITEKMATGMADYAHKAATTGSIYLETIEEYDLYCHYVAGLVGEGLSGLFSASKKEATWLKDQLELSNSTGLLLQKTNIIRDFREDVEQQRYFWPREIWGKKEYGFKEMKEMYMWDGPDGQNVKNRAMWAQSGMVVDALRHTVDSLDYLRVLKSQSIFNFCAIPQTMAMATLELCFMNPAMFQRNIKIRKAEAASLIMRSTNPREVAYLFRDYARKIHAKAVPEDPNFLRISIACGKIEQWCEHHYPSFVSIVQSTAGSGPSPVFNESDARTRIVHLTGAQDQALSRKKREEDIRNGPKPDAVARHAEQGSPWELYLYVGAALGMMGLLSLGVVYTVLYFS